MATLSVFVAVCAALGYVVARAWLVAVAVVAVVAYYLGLNSGWWGNGTGEGWQFVMVVAAVVAAAVTAAAVVLGRVRHR